MVPKKNIGTELYPPVIHPLYLNYFVSGNNELREAILEIIVDKS